MTVRTRRISMSAITLCGLLWIAGSFATAQGPKKPSGSPVVSAQKKTAPAAAPMAARLNLNTATAAQLDALPGIGPKTAQRILEYRQKIGGFKKIEQLMNVRGVGEKNFLRLKDRITVGPAKPVSRKP